MYLQELRQELIQVAGTHVSLSTICRTLKWLRHVALQRSEEERLSFMEEMFYLHADMLVWIDECGSNRRNEIRKYGYSLKGLTPTNYKFLSRGKRFSAIPVMSTRGIEDVFVTKSLNGDIFLQFVDSALFQCYSHSMGRILAL